MILSCGEALIDMLPRTSAGEEDAFSPYPGGAVFNTAIALGRLGAPAGLLSGLSSDLFGEILQTALSDNHVDSRYAIISARPTTLAFVKLADGQASYAFYDENTAGRLLRAGDLPSLPADVEALFFGGISLAAEPCGSAYETLMLREAPKRATMIDPNIRPSFVSDESSYRARIARMINAADIVKLSDEDLHWLEGGGSPMDLAQNILARGPGLVCVTEGASGAHGFTADHHVFEPAAETKVADTIGAGDTFNAGILAALHRAGALSKDALSALDLPTLRSALSLGARAAAVTVGRPGADPPWSREL